MGDVTISLPLETRCALNVSFVDDRGFDTFGDANWPKLALQLGWVILVQSVVTLVCILASRPYSAVEGAERGKLHTSAPAAKPKAGAGEKAVELTELKGAAAVAAAARGLAKVPLDKLAALSPEQLANRLRAEVEVLVGTEDESPVDVRFVYALHSCDLLCSLAVTALWIRKSYKHLVEPLVQRAELAFFVFFAVNYALRLLRAGLAPSAALSLQGFVDLLTAIPLVLQGSIWQTWISFSFMRALCSLWAYEALEASGALESFSDVRRRALVVCFRFMALVVCFAGSLFIAETLGDMRADQPGELCDKAIADAGGESVSFYEMCYFIVVTISTVGYGDFTPKTVLGRAFVSVVIVAGVAFFSVETAALINLARTEASGRGRYRPRRGRGPRHVLVAGGAVARGGATLSEFLDELAGRAGGAQPPDVVLLTPCPPSERMHELLRRAPLRRCVRFLAGSAREAGDLRRCAVDRAAGAYVLAELGGDDPEGEDEEALLTAAALHRAQPRLPLTVLVNGQRARALAAAAGLPPASVWAADELGGAMLGCGALHPGGATLLSNLARSPPAAPPRERHEPWHDEYLHGLSLGLHGAQLAAAPAQESWAALQTALHERGGGCVLLAWAPAGGDAPPLLAPPPQTRLGAGDFVWAVAPSEAHLRRLLPPRPHGVPGWREAWGRRAADAAPRPEPEAPAAAEADEPFSAPALVAAAAEAGGHVLVVAGAGARWGRADALARRLRLAPRPPPLLLLCADAPPAPLPPGALLLRGVAADADSLLAAGAARAAALVLLSTAEAEGAEGAADRRGVLACNICERAAAHAPLLLDLAQPAAIKYLHEQAPAAGGGEAAAAAPAPRAARLAAALELRELRNLLGKGLASGAGALGAVLGTELALLGAGAAPPLPPLRASACLHARFAAGRALFAPDVTRMAAHGHYTPAALALLAQLAEGGPGAGLALAPLPPGAAGESFGELFERMAAEGVTCLGLYRARGGGALPYVFTAPPPWAGVREGDRAFAVAHPEATLAPGAERAE